MSKNYILTKGAVADIKEITNYTFSKWGKEKCLKYIAEIEKSAQEIASGQGIYKNMDFLIEGLRVGRSGKHYIFCILKSKKSAIILAILHEKMDILSHIKSRL